MLSSLLLSTVMCLTQTLTSGLHKDKLAHFGVSYTLSDTLTRSCLLLEADKPKEILLPCYLIGSTTALSFGLQWELTGNQDAKDMLANLLGIALNGVYWRVTF